MVINWHSKKRRKIVSKQGSKRRKRERERRTDGGRREEIWNKRKKEERWKRGWAEEIKALMYHLASICGVNNPTTAGFSLSSI